MQNFEMAGDGRAGPSCLSLRVLGFHGESECDPARRRKVAFRCKCGQVHAVPKNGPSSRSDVLSASVASGTMMTLDVNAIVL